MGALFVSPPTPPRLANDHWRQPPAPTPPSSKLTKDPWREPNDFGPELEKQLVEKIKNVRKITSWKPSILMIGPVGAGKSSLINAICSVGEGFKVKKAPTGKGTQSFTVTYENYFDHTILDEFRLRDTMGMEYDTGLQVLDFYYLLKGHIRRNYEFQREKPITYDSKFFNRKPRFDEEIHCVVFVADGVKVTSILPDKTLDEIKKFNGKIKETQIPKLLVLTKADLVCDEVKKDVGMMFRSVAIQEAVKKASESFDIDEASIHPVVNYECNPNVTPKQNCPLLLAVRQMTQYAAGRVEHVLENKRR